jgi:hypothetical protein
MHTSPLNLRPMGFGEILDGAFSLYRRNFVTLFLTALLPMVPMMLLLSFAEQGLGTEEPALALLYAGLFVPALLVALVGSFWIWAALTWQTAEILGGRPVTVLESYRKTGRPLFGVLAVIILSGLALSALMMVLLLAGVVIVAIASLVHQTLTIFAGLVVFAAGLVAMLGAFSILFGVVPAIVLERHGPFTAMQRSAELSRGARARIVGVLVVCWLIVMLPTLGLTFGIGLGPALWDPDAAAMMSMWQVVLQQVVGIVSGALTTPFVAAAITLLYFDRRVRTEAYDLELMTQDLALTR